MRRVSKNPQTGKNKFPDWGISRFHEIAYGFLYFDNDNIEKALRSKGFCLTAQIEGLPYHLYADAFDLLVFGASMTSAVCQKILF